MSLEDLITPPTAAEIESGIYAYIASKGVSTTSWKPGGVVRTVISAFSLMLEAGYALQVAITRGGFLDLAEEAWLTHKAKYDYDVARDLGSFATGTIVANNGGGGVYAGDPDDLTVYNPTTGAAYRNTEAFSIAPMQTGVVIPIRAVELGSASSSGANQITALETVMAGVTITNPAALIGSDPETDPALRTRCREKPASLSPNGPSDAYFFFAKSATRLNGQSITRVKLVPDGYGGIDLYLATATGGVTGTVGNAATDLGKVDADLQRLVVPEGVTLRTQSATTQTIAVTYEAWVRASLGKTEQQHKDAVSAALLTYFSTLPIGGEIKPGATTGRVYLAGIRTEIGKALGATIDLVATVPAGDTDFTVSQAPIVGLIDGTVHVVPDDQVLS